jgi:hypothetical protein
MMSPWARFSRKELRVISDSIGYMLANRRLTDEETANDLFWGVKAELQARSKTDGREVT